MLPDGEQVQLVAVGPDGLAGAMAAGALLVDTSSSEPWLTPGTRGRGGRARCIEMVDAPVSGAQWGAEAADLVFMVGGADADVQRVRGRCST